jgi:hypothetical protein
VKIAFEPVQPLADREIYWYGTAWVDVDSHQVLRFEGVKAEDHLAKQRFEAVLEEDVQGGRSLPLSIWIERVTTEFDVEARGLRFPSEVIIEGWRLVSRTATGATGYRESLFYTVRQRYSGYRFYDVSAEIIDEGLLDELAGDAWPPRSDPSEP